MQVNLDITSSTYRIHGYGNGEITVSLPSSTALDERPVNEPYGEYPTRQRETLQRSFVIAPNELIRDWPPSSFADLQAEHFALLIQLKPEIVLFGTGKKLIWPQPALIAPLIEQGIGVEVMDTGAACRTYNILMADERLVAAAILID